MTCSTRPWQRRADLSPSLIPSIARFSDRLAVFLRTAPDAAEYEAEWQAFVTTLDAHAKEEERDLFPPPVKMTAAALDDLGNRMLARMDEIRGSRMKQLRVNARGALLRKL